VLAGSVLAEGMTRLKTQHAKAQARFDMFVSVRRWGGRQCLEVTWPEICTQPDDLGDWDLDQISYRVITSQARDQVHLCSAANRV
jgi:hypothetical protein